MLEWQFQFYITFSYRNHNVYHPLQHTHQLQANLTSSHKHLLGLSYETMSYVSELHCSDMIHAVCMENLVCPYNCFNYFNVVVWYDHNASVSFSSNSTSDAIKLNVESQYLRTQWRMPKCWQTWDTTSTSTIRGMEHNNKSLSADKYWQEFTLQQQLLEGICSECVHHMQLVGLSFPWNFQPTLRMCPLSQ